MIIGLCGFKGSGKSVVADYLVREHGFIKINFKDALIEHMKEDLKETLAELALIYNMTVDELFINKPPAMRALMQNYGTDIIRKRISERYWVDQLLSKLGKGNFVTDDVRFQNECDAITLSNGVIVRIIRDDVTTGGDHISETDHLNFKEDFTIEAVFGDHVGVYKQVESIIDTLKKNVD